MLNSKKGVCEDCKGGNLLNVIKNKCVQDSLANSALVAVESTTHRLLGTWRKNLNAIVTPSNFLRNKLIEWGWSSDQLVYIPNYVDSSAFTPHYEPGNYFFYFGRLMKEKGVNTLIQAAKRAGVRLLIAGTGPDEAPMRTLAEGADIEFLGYCQGERLHRLIRESRATVLSSELYENAPISILEAYACGKPVIGAHIGGIPEMIEHDESGLLYESGNINDLEKCLREIQDSPQKKLIDMGKAGQSIVRQRYTKELYQDKMLELYERIGK
jgi:glycosyltransferase involved in cell wall biosynthesis